MSGIVLRYYQDDAVHGCRQQFSQRVRSVLLVLPTGGGKTICFCYVADGAVSKGNKVLILVHRSELLQQCSDSLQAMGIEHGCIAPGHQMQLQKDVQVASIQTVVRRFHLLAAAGWSPDLVIPDEAHHATAGTWSQVLEQYPRARVLGVTATPIRGDGAGLDDVFGAMVEGPQIADLIADGWLTAPEVYAPPIVADLDGLPKRGGDFAKGEQARRMDKRTVTGDAVEHYGRICPGAPAIAFCVSVKHAEHVAAEFRAAGWKAASLDGKMKPHQRKGLIADLAEGRLHVLTSCDIISEGTDIPVVTAAILLRRTSSLGLFLQQVGRVLRAVYACGYDLSTTDGRLAAIANGPKPSAIILDHVGNVTTMGHGWPDDYREWSLEGTKGTGKPREYSPPPPVTCTGCWKQFRQPIPENCTSCNKRLRDPDADRMAGLEQLDGTLEKLDKAAFKRAEQTRKSAEKRQRAYEQAQATGISDLVALAVKRGYKNPQQWAVKVFSNRK